MSKHFKEIEKEPILDNEEFISTRLASKIIGTRIENVRKQIATKAIPAKKIGGRYYVSKRWLTNLVSDLEGGK